MLKNCLASKGLIFIIIFVWNQQRQLILYTVNSRTILCYVEVHNVHFYLLCSTLVRLVFFILCIPTVLSIRSCTATIHIIYCNFTFKPTCSWVRYSSVRLFFCRYSPVHLLLCCYSPIPCSCSVTVYSPVLVLVQSSLPVLIFIQPSPTVIVTLQSNPAVL